jgi:hypothetical protein
MGHPTINMVIGSQYGQWTVLRRDTTKVGVSYWICECACGYISSVRAASLAKGGSLSCGCSKVTFNIGYKFHYLEVIEKDVTKHQRQQYWLCKCDCGNICSLNTGTITAKGQKSCGCHVTKKWAGDSYNKVGQISGRLWRTIYNGALSRGIYFNITPNYCWNLFVTQNGKCALSGIELCFAKNSRDYSSTASLDRIDSSKGYIEGNVQWVHKHVNIMKNKFTEQYFINLCQKIVANVKI